MSLTLGEKLRQAREERGHTIGDVAEQTRISPLYIESIENDDYRLLPGGIFNKGFVKSYAKFVGMNEAEALADYSALMATAERAEEAELKVYKPQVLTDDSTSASSLPTIILAVVILGAMTAGILFLVNYLRQPDEPTVANTDARPAANTSTGETPPDQLPANSDMPDMASLKVEFKALAEPVSLTATSDGKMSSNIVPAGTVANFEPKESLKLSYSRSLANNVQLTINGKQIALPAQPLAPRRNAIEFEINKDNLGQIWTSGTITGDVPAATTVDNGTAANTAANTDNPPAPSTPPPSTPRATPAPRPANSTANTAANATRATPERRRVEEQPRPTVVVPSANRP